MAEGSGGHVGVTQHVVGAAQQLTQLIPADVYQVGVGVGDTAVEVGGGEAKSTDRPVIGRLILITGALEILGGVGRAVDSKRTH